MGDEDTLASLFGSVGSNSRGPADLDNFSRMIAGNDPWRMGGNAILGTRLNTSGMSPGANFFTNAAQAFLGNALLGYGRNQEAAQIEKLNSVLPDLYENPSSVMRPEGIDAGAFETHKANAIKDAFGRKVVDERSDRLDRRELLRTLISQDPSLARNYLKTGNIDIDAAFDDESTGSRSLESLPTSVRKQGIEEAERLGSLKNSLDYIDKQFNRANSLTGIKAAATHLTGLPTKEGNQLEAMGEALILQGDKIGGKEFNDELREQLRKAIPKYYDSQETLELKRREFKDIISSLNKGTPILDSYKLTGKYLGGAGTNMEGGGAQSSSMPTREEAIAELRRRGKL